MHDKTPIFRSLDMIEERIREKLTVEALAREIHFSKYHYQRLFREAVGDSVMGYVTRRKLALAAGELAETDSTVLEVALKYGYDSHEGFTRSFRAHMGVTPAEYRKYRLHVRPQTMEERSAMMYSKTTDKIIRELNALIAEARETADYTRKYRGTGHGEEFYGQFWEFMAARTEEMAGELAKILEQVTAIAQRPDGITARFRIIKAMEDAAFTCSVTVFQTGLMMARAGKEHREAYGPLCQSYSRLAEHARMKAGCIAAFFQELAGLIFGDMRQNGAQRIQAAVQAGRDAAGKLSDPALPYGYLAEGIAEIVKQLSKPDEVAVSKLEDLWFCMDTIAFAARTDMMREPSHEALFEGIWEFREKLNDLTKFLRSLQEDMAGIFAETDSAPARDRSPEKMYSDLAMQEGILLFWLKGEIQKLGKILEEEQKAALRTVCAKMAQAVELCGSETAQTQAEEIIRLLGEAYEGLTAQAEALGEYGGPLSYIAEEVKGPLQYLTAYR
mgnify:CR=1 FL=1